MCNFWNSCRNMTVSISETSARRVRMSSILSPWGKEVYVQLLEFWLMQVSCPNMTILKISHCQQGVGLQDGGSEDRKHQRGGLRLAITASTPGESKQGTLVDPEKIDKGVESSNRTQMKIDLEAEQDSKMELGSEGEKEAGQWSSGKKPGLDGNKTDRSHSLS